MSVRRATGEDSFIQNTCKAEALDTVTQDPMQTPPGHYVRFAAEDARCGFLYVDQFIKPEGAFGMIERQVNVGIGTCLAPCGGAEPIQMFDAELLQLGLMLFLSG